MLPFLFFNTWISDVIYHTQPESMASWIILSLFPPFSFPLTQTHINDSTHFFCAYSCSSIHSFDIFKEKCNVRMYIHICMCACLCLHELYIYVYICWPMFNIHMLLLYTRQTERKREREYFKAKRTTTSKKGYLWLFSSAILLLLVCIWFVFVREFSHLT